MSREARARAGLLLGVALIACGVGWQLGVGWGVAVVGVGIVALFVWFYDVDEPAAAPEPSARGGPW